MERRNIEAKKIALSLLLPLFLSAWMPLVHAEEWTFNVELYALAADVDITAAGGLSTTAEFDDILDDLEFAMFGSFAAKKDKFAVIFNLLYVDVEASKTRERELITSRLETELETTVMTAAAGWEFYGSETAAFHGVAGARLLSMDTSLSLDIEPLGERSDSESSEILDLVIGVQGRKDFSKHWYMTYYADAGSGDSDFTWQASAAIAYRFSGLDVALGYQYIEWEFDDELLEDLQIHGPALGVRFNW